MSRYQPALLGGLFIGVLSSLPVVNIGLVETTLATVTATRPATRSRMLGAVPL